MKVGIFLPTFDAGLQPSTLRVLAETAESVGAASLWVAGEDKILLRCDWRGLDLEYVLTTWKVEQS